jgi:hypothetical protein
MAEEEQAAEPEEEPESEDNESDGDEKKRKHYLKERDAHIDAARESSRTFDKAVLTFAAAVFGFSIAFLKDVAPHPAVATLKWLGLAWGLFACSLLLILLSFLFSHRACMFEVECADNSYIDPNYKREKNPWSRWTDRCNFACVICLFLGLGAWSCFAFENLGQESKSVSKVEPTPLKEGYVPPPPAKPQQQAPPLPPPL